jgi:hypothetical protein
MCVRGLSVRRCERPAERAAYYLQNILHTSKRWVLVSHEALADCVEVAAEGGNVYVLRISGRRLWQQQLLSYSVTE